MLAGARAPSPRGAQRREGKWEEGGGGLGAQAVVQQMEGEGGRDTFPRRDAQGKTLRAVCARCEEEAAYSRCGLF